MDRDDVQAGYVPIVGSSAAAVPGRASSSRSYARWNQADTRKFIAVCETAISEGHRNGKCFTKHGWERIIALFNSSTGHNWTRQQLRNHWDAMRRTYRRLSELVNCSGVEYNPCTGKIVASEEWWSRKIKENKDYKDFKDKDVSEIYTRYRELFGDSFDADKYAVTPTKLCSTGYGLFEDSATDDHRDAFPVDVEGSGSSDEAVEVHGPSGMKDSGTTSGGKRKSSSGPRRDKKKKVSARELSFSVDRVTSVAEDVAAKINTMMTSNENAGADCVEELLATGRLQRRTPLYFFAVTIMAQKRYRDMLRVMKDADEKFEWLEWFFSERDKQWK